MNRWARRLSWLISVPITLITIIFAVWNRQLVTLDLFPLPLAPELPVYLLVLGSLFIGFILGGLTAWIAARPARRQRRRMRAESDALAREVADLRSQRAKPATGVELVGASGSSAARGTGA
jgi:lipopolysaccharide assembly protein A